jgi:hypothetical protein
VVRLRRENGRMPARLEKDGSVVSLSRAECATQQSVLGAQTAGGPNAAADGTAPGAIRLACAGGAVT